MSETVTVTLTDFLLARIAEDEEAARAAGGEWWWPAEIPGEAMRKSADEPTKVVIDSPSTLITYEVCKPEHADHIVRHDPEGVLAECEAKRRIAELHPPGCFDGYGEGEDPCLTLRALALPYADHPGFREEWRSDYRDERRSEPRLQHRVTYNQSPARMNTLPPDMTKAPAQPEG